MIKKSFQRKILMTIFAIVSFSIIFSNVFESNIIAMNGEVNELGIIGTIVYSEDRKKANLSIDQSKLDKNVYAIEQVLGPSGEVLSLENPTVSVDKNAEYTFTIIYYNKEIMKDITQRDNDNMKGLEKLEIKIKVEGINKNVAVPKKDEPTSKKNTAVNKKSEFPPQPLANMNSVIHIKDQFNISAFASNYTTITGNDITDNVIDKINGNYIATTIAGLGAYQGTSLTSKNTLNFAKNFKIKGSIKQAPYGCGEGFLFAFHNNPSYKYGGGDSSNLAFYNFNNTGFKGNALVIEADLFNNNDKSHVALYGDYPSNGYLFPHMNVLRMNASNPKSPQRLAELPISVDDLEGERQFEIRWDATTSTIHFLLNKKLVSYTGYDVEKELGTEELYFTIGGATGQGGTNGFDSGFTYDELVYYDLDAKATTAFTTKDKDDNDVIISSTSSNDFTNYGKPGDIIHVVHRLTNENIVNNESVTENVSIKNSTLGAETLLPIAGTLKTYTDKNMVKKDINEDIFHGEYTIIDFIPKKDGASYIEYDVKLPDRILEQNDLETTIAFGKKKSTQKVFHSIAKIAGNPTLKNVVDLDYAIGDSVISGTQVGKQGLKGHTFDTTDDLEMTVDNPNLKLDYIIKDMNGNIKTVIPLSEPGMYKVDYTLTDTRTGSNLTNTASRYIRVSDKHLIESGIVVLTKNIIMNEVELRQHEVDLTEYLKKELKVKTYWMVNETEIKDFTIDLQGLSYTSKAKEMPYKVKIIVEKDGSTATLEAEVFITPDVMGFLEIPSYVYLSNTGGMDSDHAGAKVDIKITDGIKPGVVYDIKADADFDISNTSGESFVVSLYDNKKALFIKDNEGKAVLGSIDELNRSKQIWYNILKDYNRDVSSYEGTMIFYINANKENT